MASAKFRYYFLSNGYAYTLTGQSWVYFNPADTVRVYDYRTGQWSEFNRVGSGDVSIMLSWDNTADVDLHVLDPFNEEIYYGHRLSASGGQLDRDDTNGYGPENIFWPVNGAPHGTYVVKVHHYSGALPSNWNLTIVYDGNIRTFTGTLSTAGQWASHYANGVVHTFTR